MLMVMMYSLRSLFPSKPIRDASLKFFENVGVPDLRRRGAKDLGSHHPLVYHRHMTIF